MRDGFHWARLLGYVTGLVNQELLLRNEYLAAENRILRAHLPSLLRLSDSERFTLTEIAKRLGRKALKDIAWIAKPDTILSWYRQLIAWKFDGSRHRGCSGPPRSSGLGSNRGQYLASAQHRTSARAESRHDLEGIHPVAHGRAGRS